MKTILVIESNGGVHDTRVTNTDGVNLSHLMKSVEWRHDAGSLPEARIIVHRTPLSVRGKVAEIQDDAGNRIRRIVYADGTELSAED